jgi:methionine-rich copper-binding protein CopC
MKKTYIPCVAAALVLMTSSAAFAHAQIASSSIANGGSVQVAPSSYSVTFSAPVRLASVSLTNSAGQQIPTTFRAGAAPSPTFTVPLPRLAAGTYQLAFRSMGADGHAMASQTRFTIGNAPQNSATSTAPAMPSSMQGMDHSKMGGMAGMNHSGGSMQVTTSIADGAVLTTPPTSIRVNFPHAMRLTSARLSVASGETIPLRLPSAAGPTSMAEIPFPRLDADSYVLTWGADAGDHSMSGTVRFRVR